MFIIMDDQTEEVLARFETEAETEYYFPDYADDLYDKMPNALYEEFSEVFRYDWREFCKEHDYEFWGWIAIYKEMD